MLADISRLARRAWGVVRRHPIMSIAVVALAVLVATMLFMGREGWTFKGEKTELSEQHAVRIKELCATGMNFKQIQADPQFEQFAKYTENAAWKACEKGFKVREEGMKSVVESGAVKPEHCKTGKLCPVLTLRSTRPCLNQDGKRCCTQKNKLCRPMQLAGQSNFEYTDRKWAEEDKAKYGDAAGKQAEPWGGCAYTSRVADNGQWVCPKQYQYATDVEKLPGIEAQSQEQFYRQCAKSQNCADKLKKHYKDNPPVPAAANAAAANAAPVVEGVVAYQHANKQGPSTTFSQVGTMVNLERAYDDWISSVYVPAGRQLVIYQKKDGGGKSLTLGPGDHNLSDYSFPGGQKKTGSLDICGMRNNGCWNDSASSVMVL